MYFHRTLYNYHHIYHLYNIHLYKANIIIHFLHNLICIYNYLSLLLNFLNMTIHMYLLIHLLTCHTLYSQIHTAFFLIALLNTNDIFRDISYLLSNIPYRKNIWYITKNQFMIHKTDHRVSMASFHYRSLYSNFRYYFCTLDN